MHIFGQHISYLNCPLPTADRSVVFVIFKLVSSIYKHVRDVTQIPPKIKVTLEHNLLILKTFRVDN